MIARQTLNIYIQYLKNLPRLRGYSLVYVRCVGTCISVYRPIVPNTRRLGGQTNCSGIGFREELRQRKGRIDKKKTMEDQKAAEFVQHQTAATGYDADYDDDDVDVDSDLHYYDEDYDGY